ncbi:hypothetical protein [Paraburkholderia ferrariae]|uniref:hypothetical protein n=1 Tax=Paraburkholderia ferrariae TaxID=386056 RepID=UPI0004858820|nr:hypothetical protein [Paraburkholderia ferrariae]
MGSDWANYWILLDGEWAVEQGGKVVRVGRSDPGKWFPEYVPEDIRHYVTRQLDQFSRLHDASQQKLGDLRRRADTGTDEADQVEVRNETKRRDYWVLAAARMQRIVSDLRLRTVFEQLEAEVSDGSECVSFFHAALNADNDYSEFRDANKEALSVAQQISVAADRLAEMLQQFERVGIGGPSEFFSVRELLRVADCTGVRAGRRQRWLADRDSLLGSSIADEPGNDDRLKMLWASAPLAEDLLRAMASAARRFEPYEDGPAGAALDSRQRNRKWEYLRAFIYELLDNGFRPSSPKISAAVAAMATVVLDTEDVTDDDVRKAVKRVAAYSTEEMGR